MFVSSYSTYIQTNNSQKVVKQEFDKQTLNAKKFSAKLSTLTTPASSLKTLNVPIDYASKGLVLNNRQELENKKDKGANSLKNNLDKFSLQNSLKNAKSAYEKNSKMFSLIHVPQIALNQTPSTKTTLPIEPKEIKESNIRHKMINTYLANENYHKITA